MTVTKAFVALVLTAAFEFFKPVFKNSIRLRIDKPAIPNSVRAVSIQAVASAINLGAFCFDRGSYAMIHFSHDRHGRITTAHLGLGQIVRKFCKQRQSMHHPPVF